MKQRGAEVPTQLANELAQILQDNNIPSEFIFAHSGSEQETSFFLTPTGEWQYQNSEMLAHNPGISIVLHSVAEVVTQYGRLDLAEYRVAQAELAQKLQAAQQKNQSWDDLEAEIDSILHEYEPLLDSILEESWEVLCATIAQILLKKIQFLQEELR